DKTIKASNFLGSVCGRVCPQESQCEGQCILSRAHKPIAIGNLERFVSDKCADGQLDRPQQHLDLRVAVVGSGPSGLTCAYELARAGISVTIYEAFHRGGGVLTYGIPSFRLPKNIVNNQLNKLSALGVEIKYDIVIGKTLTIKQLLEDFDAVYVASGAGLPMFMNILGENLNGIVSANEFLTRVNLMNCANPSSKTPLYVGKDVIVVGAGNVAMDSARTAKRLGAKVTVVYRRSEAEMPARKEEIAHAKEEGIDFMLLTNPIAFNGVGKVESATLIKMQLGEVDASGRRGVTEIVGSEFTLPCDNVIIALGTKTSPLLTESEKTLLLTKKGTIVVDESKRT
ncbi:MAG: FAD-dependent oxidoreductase, partial [Clostridia bacterium]